MKNVCSIGIALEQIFIITGFARGQTQCNPYFPNRKHYKSSLKNVTGSPNIIGLEIHIPNIQFNKKIAFF
ncbi:hypothetical protein, partial [Rickettsia endosymbiont of Orchestes rusci]|uniref:hypothetical protein n=1 Tax=Rickettsia endosymbiont of Orchestes rusci TaxID=3066250 RepID=UPI00313B5D7A